MLDQYSDDIILPALIYGILSCFILIWSLNIITKAQNAKITHQRFRLVFLKYKHLIFFLSIIGLLGTALLNLVYGQAQTNIVASRPFFATFIGYVCNPLSMLCFLYIACEFYIDGKASKYSIFLFLLFLIEGSLAGSRSQLFSMVAIVLVLASFSPVKLRINFFYASIVLLLGIISVLVGEIIRDSDLSIFVLNALSRFFQFNVVLLLAMEDFSAVNGILLANQPETLFSQLFSFSGIEKLPPSSVRLPEYWGSEIVLREDGHMVGYVYGWMGLSFGLFQWGGLFFTMLFFLISLFLIKKCIQHPSIGSFIILTILLLTFYEFFGNLGLDSFIEKIFKRTIWGVLLYLIFLFLAPFSRPIKIRS